MKHERKILFVALAGLTASLAFHSVAQAAPSAKRYLVEFASGKTNNGKAALRSAGAVIKLDLARHNAVAVEIPDSKIAAVRANPNIKTVELDERRYPISMVRSLPSGSDRVVAAGEESVGQIVPYGVPLVQADKLEGNTSSGVKVCVIDSGYDLGHEDLAAAPVVGGSDDLDGAGPWDEDGDGHGTHVAGTIHALDNDVGVVGVFPNVPMHIVRVFGDDGLWAYSSQLINAVDECVGAGAKVINMSLGGPLPSVLENAVFLNTLKSGVLSIAAAGNGGEGRVCDIFADPSRPERQACKMHYPSGYDSVVSVAAVDDKAVVASFSQINSKVEIAAPGVSVLSSVPTGSMIDSTLQSALGNTEVFPMTGSPIPSTPVSGLLKDCGLATTAADCGNATGMMCLIERGAVTFAEKALACEAAGGIGAVVFQRTGADAVGPVLGTLGDTVVSIPVVGTDRDTGLALRATELNKTATLTFAVSDYNYDHYSGTSMATPHVAGVAALLWSRHTSCGPTDIRNAMNATAVDLGPKGRDKYYGNGLLQALAADSYLASKGCSGN